MQLHYRKYGEEGRHPLIILHGLFGLGDNWGSYARRIADEGFEVFVPDQRNHGQSPHNDVFNYLALSDDLAEFIEEHQLEGACLLGHSMGGKVAMRYTLENPDVVEKIIVVDITLKSYGKRPYHRQLIDAMQAVRLEGLTHRNDVEEQLKSMIASKPIRNFLMKNLYWKTKKELAWRLNLPSLEENLDHMFDGIDLDIQFRGPALFVKGGNSHYIQLEDFEQIRYNFPESEIMTIENTSHWVHAEAPEKFFLLTSGFLTGAPSWYIPKDKGVIREP